MAMWNYISLTSIFCRAILFSVGQGDSHYRWGNQLLLAHHVIFMKHLANGLEVNISFTDKTETYTQNRTSKWIALSTSYSEQKTLGCLNVTKAPILMGWLMKGLLNKCKTCALWEKFYTLCGVKIRAADDIDQVSLSLMTWGKKEEHRLIAR